MSGFPAVYLGLGANVGNRAANLRMALRYLFPLARVDAASSLFETAAAGETEQPPFYNAVCRLQTGLRPNALLHYLKQVEFEIGRRPGPRWGPRPIDLDILLWGDEVVETDLLTVPHPLLAERAFALVPLAELAPELIHPVLRRPVVDLVAALGEGELAGVRRIAPPGWEQPLP